MLYHELKGAKMFVSGKQTLTLLYNRVDRVLQTRISVCFDAVW